MLSVWVITEKGMAHWMSIDETLVETSAALVLENGLVDNACCVHCHSWLVLRIA